MIRSLYKSINARRLHHRIRFVRICNLFRCIDRSFHNSLGTMTISITPEDRLLRMKPYIVEDSDNSEVEDDEQGDDLDEFQGDDPTHKLGKYLLKMGKVHHRHIEQLPIVVKQRQAEILQHRTPAQVRRCLKTWMMKPDRELQGKYIKRPLKWQSSSMNDTDHPIFAYGPEEAIAYCFYLFPGRFAIITRVLREIEALVPEYSPKRVLDFGCGPATAGIAAKGVFKTIEKYVAIDMSASMLDAARIMMEGESTDGSGIIL